MLAPCATWHKNVDVDLGDKYVAYVRSMCGRDLRSELSRRQNVGEVMSATNNSQLELARQIAAEIQAEIEALAEAGENVTEAQDALNGFVETIAAKTE